MSAWGPRVEKSAGIFKKEGTRAVLYKRACRALWMGWGRDRFISTEGGWERPVDGARARVPCKGAWKYPIGWVVSPQGRLSYLL